MKPALYGLMAEFSEPQALLEATRRAYEAGYRKMDAYSPQPVEGLAEALGFHRTSIPLLVLVGGLFGCVGALFMQNFAEAIHYPINVGGRPLSSWPSFIPITFELTVLSGALAGFIGMLALNRLPLPYHPVFNVPEFARASRDRFFLCIEAADPIFDLIRTTEFMRSLKPESIREAPA